MVKHFSILSIFIILLTACDNPVNTTTKPIDTFSTTDMSQKERAILIDGAKHNQEMIIGSWELLAADSEKVALPKSQLAKMIVAKIDFLDKTKFQFRPLHGPADTGTYEWMAENREIVLTTPQGTRRMLVKKIDSLSMVTKTGDLRFMFKRKTIK